MRLAQLLGQGGGICDLEVLEGVELAPYSTAKLQARGDLVVVRSVAALQKLLPTLNRHRVVYRPLGLGANQILSGGGAGVLVKLKLPFSANYLAQRRECYHLPASVSLALLIRHAQKFHLRGWECMTGIPATVGGAAYMNAGIRTGAFSSLVSRVYLVGGDGGQRQVSIGPESYSYRQNHFVQAGEVIYAVDLVNRGEDLQVGEKIERTLKQRASSQPWREKTCGCVFKNVSLTCRVGHYIDILNLQGLSYRGVCVSRLHGNFFVNQGGALAESFVQLVSIVQEELYLQLGKKFEPEVKIWA